MTITYNRKFFDSTYYLQDATKQVGYLRNDPWKNHAIGIYNGKQYNFKSTGVFRQVTLIIDPSTQETLGSIKFDDFRSKAYIRLKDSPSAMLKATNFSRTHWTLTGEESIQINVNGWSSNGNITASDEVPEVYILAGLFATNHIAEYTALFIILITIIIVS